MLFRHGEQDVLVAPPEPQPLGIEVDSARAALYEEFAQGRSLDEVYQLWRDPAVTNLAIRQRAVAVLTAPHGYDVPYPHPDQSIGRLLAINEVANGQLTTSLRERLAGRPGHAQELALGMLYWLETTGGRIENDSLDSRFDYQRAIPQLLPLVDEPTADRLFSHYSLKDLETFANLEDESGYQPLVTLLTDSAVPRKYREYGLHAWLQTAHQEETGQSQPRADHERAIVKMAEAVQAWTAGDGVDNAIHTTIIKFLESHTPAGVTYVDGYAARRVADHITDQSLCYEFAWRHVVTGSDTYWRNFQIVNDLDLALVQWIRTETLRRGSFQFDAKAEALMTAYEAERQNQRAKESAEAALQARLRA